MTHQTLTADDVQVRREDLEFAVSVLDIATAWADDPTGHGLEAYLRLRAALNQTENVNVEGLKELAADAVQQNYDLKLERDILVEALERIANSKDGSIIAEDGASYNCAYFARSALNQGQG